MPGLKRGVAIASTLMMVAIIASGCNQPYSQAPVVTNTPIDPNSLFATPLGGATEMSDIEVFATQTARAANPGAQVTASPGGGIVTPQNPTVTLTPFVSLPSNPTLTPTATLAVPAGVTLTPLPGGPTTTPAPSGSRPLDYTFQEDEFPYCIARRFNLDPESLINKNGLSNGTLYFAGYTLNLREVASPFPGARALRPHPASYTVTGNADTTVYGVACKFGDIFPEAIANPSANAGITLNSVLTVGQVLNIP